MAKGKFFGNKSGHRDFLAGFTFIEVAVVLAVVVILAGIIFYGLTSFRQAADLNRTTDGVMAKFNEARQRTVESRNSSQWGVHIENSSATLFRGTTYSSGASDNEVMDFPDTVTAAGASDTTFKRITGEASATGTVTFQLVSDPTKIRTLIIQLSGLVEIQ